ncbi:hypothetical protein [Mycolicibacterium iranicum]|uniref:hypothetical protein n=1 Tax=Mycolicibacterium iranicum TaxID=912594 RepID=UPI000466556D|nr:hypothetical protein [Mycolicibacterium iranicum]
MTTPHDGQPVGATLRWYTRSVERRYDEDVESWRDNPPENTGITVQFGARLLQLTQDEDTEIRAPAIRVRLVLRLEQANVSAKVDGGVEFPFAPGTDVTREQAAQFVREHGLAYLLGMERGVLADLTREVGLSAVLVPFILPEGLLDDIEESLSVEDEFV